MKKLVTSAVGGRVTSQLTLRVGCTVLPSLQPAACDDVSHAPCLTAAVAPGFRRHLLMTRRGPLLPTACAFSRRCAASSLPPAPSGDEVRHLAYRHHGSLLPPAPPDNRARLLSYCLCSFRLQPAPIDAALGPLTSTYLQPTLLQRVLPRWLTMSRKEWPAFAPHLHQPRPSSPVHHFGMQLNFKIQQVTSSLTIFSHASTLLLHEVLSQVSDDISNVAAFDTP